MSVGLAGVLPMTSHSLDGHSSNWANQVVVFIYYFDMNILLSGITACVFSFCVICGVGVRVFIPNFVQIDAMDHKENLRKIENAGVSYPMGEWQQSLQNDKK